MLEDRRRAIRNTLKAIDDKLRAVQANSASVEEALYQKLQVSLYKAERVVVRVYEKCHLALASPFDCGLL